MNDPRTTTATAQRRGVVTVHRQPVVRPDRSVHGYAVDVVVRAPLGCARPGDERDAMWFVLSRALACRTLGGDDAAYTVGLLSAVAAQLRVAPAELIERAGVSTSVADAVLTRSGPYGTALAAVLAHEENDLARVEATGLASATVANAYLDAVADALATARSLAS